MEIKVQFMCLVCTLLFRCLTWRVRDAEFASAGDEYFVYVSSQHDLSNCLMLFVANEEATTELIAKYQDKSGNYMPETINNLFRWVAILRAELSESRSRTNKLRKEVHQLRIAKQMATFHASNLQRALDQSCARLSRVEADLTQLCNERYRPSDSFGSPFATTAAETSSMNTPTSSANESRLGLKLCLNYIDMSTPELNDVGILYWLSI